MVVEGFQQIRVIGKGAFGAAILVKRNGVQFVIKEVVIDGLSSREKLEAQNEAKLLRQLDNPYIVKYVDSGVSSGKLWIAMDYCSGGDLDEFINAKRKSSLFLTESEALGIFGQICLALNYIHEKHILHRDLKSKNIFLACPAVSGQIPQVKLGDFGIAKVLANTRDKAKTQIGTPYYLSPEICEDKPYGTKSDVWAMGCILYELLALKVPFVAKDIAGLARRIMFDPAPPIPAQYRSVEGLAKLVDSLLRKDFNRRPSIAEVLQEPCVIKAIKQLPALPAPAPVAPAPISPVKDAVSPAKDAIQIPPNVISSPPSVVPSVVASAAKAPSVPSARKEGPLAVKPAVKAAAPKISPQPALAPARIVRGPPPSVMAQAPRSNLPPRQDKQQLEEWRSKYKEQLEKQQIQQEYQAPFQPQRAERVDKPSSQPQFSRAPTNSGANEFLERRNEAKRNAQRYKSDYDYPPSRASAPDNDHLPGLPNRELSQSRKLAIARQDFMDRQQAAQRNAAKINSDLDRPVAVTDEDEDRVSAVRAQRDLQKEHDRKDHEEKLAAARKQAYEDRQALNRRNEPPRVNTAHSMESTIVLSRGRPSVPAVNRVRDQRQASKEQERAAHEKELAEARRIAFEERMALKARIEQQLNA